MRGRCGGPGSRRSAAAGPAAGGRVGEAEPLGDGFVVWDAAAPAAAPPVLHLRLLGGAPRARVGREAPVALGLRHAEVLCVLALHPEGLTAEELTPLLYGRAARTSPPARCSAGCGGRCPAWSARARTG